MPLYAPYNFVPINKVQWTPGQEWEARVSHDIPLRDGYCGEIKIKVLPTPGVPFLIGGEGEVGNGKFYRTPDRRLAIPGSSLRGLIRSVVEIISFGKLSFSDVAVNGESASSTDLDLADMLFGTVGPSNGVNLKGRVSFGVAIHNTLRLHGPEPMRKIQERPRITERRFYYEDNRELRGRKRYPARTLRQVDKKSEDSRGTLLYPMEFTYNDFFDGYIKFHNINKIELGALIWALTWGGDKTLCHMLGRGKPFGFGSCRISIESLDAISNNTGEREDNISDSALVAFQESMERFVSDNGDKIAFCSGTENNWQNTHQLVQLMGMATPSNSEDKNLSYMGRDEGKGETDLPPYVECGVTVEDALHEEDQEDQNIPPDQLKSGDDIVLGGIKYIFCAPKPKKGEGVYLFYAEVNPVSFKDSYLRWDIESSKWLMEK